MKKINLVAKIPAIFIISLLAGCGGESFQSLPTRIADFKGIFISDSSPAPKSSKKQNKKIAVKDSIANYQSLKGKATLIVLNASWCPPCQAEIPLLKKLNDDYKNRGLTILMVNEDDSPAVASRYKKKAGINWPMIHWNYDIMNILGNPGVIPVSYLVNAQDSIIKIDAGIFNDQEMRSQLERILR